MCHLFKKFLSLFYELKKKAESRKKYKTKHIARLSPVYPDDYNENEYSVYSDYLKKAFSDSNIRNIAITGNYGIGKSSFVKKWSNKKKYLFVSLCSFSEKSSKNLECDLLQQLLLGCGYVAKNNNYIERKWSIIKKIIVFILGFSISATIYFLVFFDIFKPTFSAILKPVLNALKLSLPSQFIATIKCIVYCLFSISMIIGLSIVVFKVIRHYKLTKIAFKLSNTEIETECKDNLKTSYMDYYRLDLVYALRHSAKNFDYTIVFEDMDRLVLNDCRSLFTELREINRLINLHTLTKNPKRTLRFVYVIHDAVFCDEDNSQNGQDPLAHNQDQLIHLKFFDYIMPIVPSMIEKSSSNYVTNSFMRIGFSHKKFINEIAVHLSDYRLIKNITNEYEILKDVYLIRNDLDNLISEEEQQLMALTIYKVVLPLDYKKIREGTSAVFSPNCSSKLDAIKSEVVKCLINNGWLSYKCLKFVGYDPYEIKKYVDEFFGANACIDDDNNQIRRKMLREDFTLCYEIIISKLNKNEDITACLSSVCYTMIETVINSKSIFFYEHLISKILKLEIKSCENFESFHENSLILFMETTSKEKNSSQELIIVIQYLLKINHDNFNWFFTNPTDSIDASRLDDFRWKTICEFNNTLINSFIRKSSSQLSNWLNAFYSQPHTLKKWRTDCSKETANALLQLPLNSEMRNWLNSMI